MIHGSRTRLNMAGSVYRTRVYQVRHKELWVQTVHSKHMNVRMVLWLTTSWECRRSEVRILNLTLWTDEKSVWRFGCLNPKQLSIWHKAGRIAESARVKWCQKKFDDYCRKHNPRKGNFWNPLARITRCNGEGAKTLLKSSLCCVSVQTKSIAVTKNICAPLNSLGLTLYRRTVNVFRRFSQNCGMILLVSSRLSARPQCNNSAPIRRIFTQFDIGVFFENLSRKL